MPIFLSCSCGQQLQTDESNSGKLVKCPSCEKLVGVPDVQKSVAAPAAPVAAAPPAQKEVADVREEDLVSEAESPPPLPDQDVPQTEAKVQGDPPATVVPVTPPPLPNQSTTETETRIQAGASAATAQPEQQIATVLDADSTPILEEEEEDVESESRWYDARPTGKLSKKRRAGLKMEKEHLELQKEAESLRKTNFGLTLIHYGIIFLMLTFLLGIGTIMVIVMTAIVGASSRDIGSLVTGSIFVLILLMALFAVGLSSQILNVGGMFFCCFSPTRSKSRHFAITALLFQLLFGLPFGIGFFLLLFKDSFGIDDITAGVVLLAGQLGTYVFMLASMSLFYLFIRNFSYFLEEGGIVAEARDLLATWLWTGTIGPAVQIANIIMLQVDEYLFMGFAALNGMFTIYWLWQFVWQWIRLLNTIGSLRQVLIVFYEM